MGSSFRENSVKSVYTHSPSLVSAGGKSAAHPGVGPASVEYRHMMLPGSGAKVSVPRDVYFSAGCAA